MSAWFELFRMAVPTSQIVASGGHDIFSVWRVIHRIEKDIEGSDDLPRCRVDHAGFAVSLDYDLPRWNLGARLLAIAVGCDENSRR